MQLLPSQVLGSKVPPTTFRALLISVINPGNEDVTVIYPLVGPAERGARCVYIKSLINKTNHTRFDGGSNTDIW